jgi:hypothetical protein
VQRYACQICDRSFSSATLSANYRQRKIACETLIDQLLVAGVSQRRAHVIAKVTRRTLVRKFRRIALRKHEEHRSALARLQPIRSLQFDEMETFEHTRLKPLSIIVAVEPATRFILAARVAQMPCKGTLAELSRWRYGHREDERPRALIQVLEGLKPLLAPDVSVTTDQCPRYPSAISRVLPQATHTAVKGRKARRDGLGELKRGGFDPIFSLNHTCAMFRANVNRLFRRTWCTTKLPEELQRHLNLYVREHNERRLRRRPPDRDEGLRPP